MNIDFSKVRIFIRPGHTDLRKAANGLAIIVDEEMAGEPFSGNLYLFCNKDRKLLKAIYWDRNGFWLNHRIQRIRKGLSKRNTPGLKQKKPPCS